jgi:thiaminase/transcriptional activator TenA
MPILATGASARLRDASEPAWSSLAAHPFLRELAAGELATARFLFYIEQNLHYLPQYARVMALGAAKARDERELALFTAALRQVIETEIPENRALRDRMRQLGIGRGDDSVEAAVPGDAGAPEPAPANLAYTGWLLSTAFTFGPCEILAALLPCTWSYGEIGRRLAPEAADHPVYREWLGFFAGDQYRVVVERMRQDLDDLAGDVDGDDLERLQDIFRTGVRLERGFWDMAYTISGRSDLPSDI